MALHPWRVQLLLSAPSLRARKLEGPPPPFNSNSNNPLNCFPLSPTSYTHRIAKRSINCSVGRPQSPFRAADGRLHAQKLIVSERREAVARNEHNGARRRGTSPVAPTAAPPPKAAAAAASPVLLVGQRQDGPVGRHSRSGGAHMHGASRSDQAAVPSAGAAFCGVSGWQLYVCCLQTPTINAPSIARQATAHATAQEAAATKPHATAIAIAPNAGGRELGRPPCGLHGRVAGGRKDLQGGGVLGILEGQRGERGPDISILRRCLGRAGAVVVGCCGACCLDVLVWGGLPGLVCRCASCSLLSKAQTRNHTAPHRTHNHSPARRQ